MIKRHVDENAVSVIAEDPDDMLSLRRVIKPGDRVTGDTYRTIKLDREYARPGKGERVRIRVALAAERVSLDDALDRLRVSGTILESNNESVPHGSHHALTLRINEGFTISKKRWSGVERRLLRSGGGHAGFVLVAIDTSDCGVASLKGTHVELSPNIYSGAGGKRYKTSFDIGKFFERARRALDTAGGGECPVVVFGPGETKRKFANFLQARGGYSVRVAEGIDSGGEDGIYTFTKSQVMREIMSESKLARVSSIIDEVMVLASRKSRKFTMGLEETRRADGLGAVRLLVFSDRAIQSHDEDAVIGLLNSAEGKGAQTFGVDSTTDLGLRVTGLGGIVSLLRYALDA